jgi:hypothetical protein
MTGNYHYGAWPLSHNAVTSIGTKSHLAQPPLTRSVGDGMLFPEITSDVIGRIAINASREIGEWID